MEYKTGDLCWAKMKGYPSWPGKIMDEPNSKKNRYQGNKRLYHYVYFFGSNNYAWVETKKIKPNSEGAIKDASRTKTLQKAVQELKREMVEGNFYYRQGIVKKCYIRLNKLRDDFPEFKESSSFIRNEALSRELTKPKSEESIKEASQTKALHKAVQELEKEIVEGNYLKGIVKKCHKRVDNLSDDFSELKESNSLTQNETLSLELSSETVMDPRKNIQKLDDSALNMGNMINDLGTKSMDCQEMMPRKFGFIGHGEIGKEILKNVLKSKCDVTIWAQTSIEYDLSDKYKTAYSFLELIISCDIILCYIDSEDSTQSFLKGDQSILDSFITYPSEGKGFALLGNVDLQDYAETAAKIQSSGAKYIGAPLIGSKTQASCGEILILFSGDQSLFDDCKAAFISYQRVKYIGPNIELAPKIHTIIRLLLNSVSKSYKETINLIQSLELPLQIFKCLFETLFHGNSLENFCDSSFEKQFSHDDRIRFFLEELNLKTLLAVNFPK